MAKRKEGEVKGKKEEKGFAKSFLEGVPFLGGLVKELSKTEVFKKKLQEVDERIEENLGKGRKKAWGFEANISVMPIIEEAKKEGGEVFIGADYLTGLKGDKLVLAAKAPQEEVQIELKGKTIKLQAKEWKKVIELPGKFSKLKNIRHKNGILMLELAK